MHAMTTIGFLSLGLWFAGLLVFGRIRLCPRPESAGGESMPSLSVIIPARNEAHNLPALLASLRDQRPAPAACIVVDDGSEDGTGDLARRFGSTAPFPVEVIRAAERPEGWTGKSWACWTGAEAAKSGLLLFLDADTRLAPTGIARLFAAWRERGGLLSVQPRHRMERLTERLSAFFNISVMAGLGAFSVAGSRVEPSGAFGPCLLCSRDAYCASGGHRGVRASIVEDIALARAFQAQGFAVDCRGGRGTIEFRMYPGGFGELLEGWTKNVASGAAGSKWWAVLLLVLWMSGALAAALTAILSPPGGFLLYLAYALQIGLMLRRIGSFGIPAALFYPVPLLFFFLVFFRSLYLTKVRRRVVWKGRSIDLRKGG